MTGNISQSPAPAPRPEPWHGMVGMNSPIGVLVESLPLILNGQPVAQPEPAPPPLFPPLTIREWNATLEKEWRDAESRYKQLNDARGQHFDAIKKQLEGLIAAGGPAMLLHLATKVRELLRPLDPTASAK